MFSENIYIEFYVHNGVILGEDYSKSNGEITCKYRYFYDKEGITGMQYIDKIYNFVKDALGNVTIKYFEDISDDEKHVLDNNPFSYRGYYYDVETSLFWLSSRYYSPELCRFISPDDIVYLDPESVNRLNLYCYCLNNAISYCDPSGHWVETVFDLLSAATSVVEVVINPLDPWVWAGLVGDALDLIPFVTWVGESIKGVRVVGKGVDLADDTLDTVMFVKAADIIDDFSDGGTVLRRVGNLDNYRTLTKTNHVDGTNLHTLFMKNGKTIKNTRKKLME